MHQNQAKSVRRLTTAGVLAASIVLLTTLVSIPMPSGFGYINLGDVGVLLAGMLLGGGWGALCAGAASALSDVLLGWGVYAPATFLIKGAVALVAGLLFAKTEKKIRYAALFLAALIVPLGYFLYETVLYTFAGAIVNVALNTVQGMTGAVVATILGVMLLKTNLFARENAASPACAETLREPKNGPDVVLLADRAQEELIMKAGDMLSVQGIMARIVAIDDKSAFERLTASQRACFLPAGKPFVQVENADMTPKEVMQAAIVAKGK
ncbi:MAG: ECF transporter S component [Eubacteriales bacterium]|jgi:uncharacterized membrane protein|nr:ECF transporter S component [Eubacteriales bacterium]